MNKLKCQSKPKVEAATNEEKKKKKYGRDQK